MKVIGEPQAGHYRVRLIKGGIRVPVLIWFGAPIFDGETLDRSPRWCAMVDGATTRPAVDADGNVIDGVRELLDVHETWPFCEPITQREYEFMRGRTAWAHEHAPEHPAATPRKRIDLSQLPPRW